MMVQCKKRIGSRRPGATQPVALSDKSLIQLKQSPNRTAIDLIGFDSDFTPDRRIVLALQQRADVPAVGSRRARMAEEIPRRSVRCSAR
jgi:hypothetical protein